MIPWELIAAKIQEQIGETDFHTWFAPIQLVHYDKDELVLGIPSHFPQASFSTKYEPLIREIVHELTAHTPLIRYRHINETPLSTAHLPGNHTVPLESELNPNFDFEHFMVDHSNRLPFKISFTIATTKHPRFNPFFVFGPEGFGKTHLLQAIGNHAVRSEGFARVCYLRAQRFSELLQAYRKRHSPSRFHSLFSDVDILLIDDIHLWAHRYEAQREFIALFNRLFHDRRQIVISADRPPMQLPGLDEQLRSRLGWGIRAEILPPTPELRAKIVRARSAALSFELPQEVERYLVGLERMNLKDLETAVIRLATYASLTRKPVTLSQAKSLLETPIEGAGPDIIQRVKKRVSSYFGLTPADLDSRSKSRTVTLARQTAIYLARQFSGEPYSRIAAKFGGKDHSTAVRSCKRMARMIEENPEVREMIRELKILLNS